MCYMETDQCHNTREIHPDARPSMVGSGLDAMCSTLLCDSDEKVRMERFNHELLWAGIKFEVAMAAQTN